MSTALITSTSFIGLDINITRTAKWETRVQENVSGKETRVSYRTIPRWNWELKFNFLRNSTSNAAFGNSTEFASFVDFYNLRAGGFDSFQWQDPEDNSGTLETALLISSVSGTYQLQRAIGTVGVFMEPIYAPSAVSQVFIGNSSAISSASTVGITTGFWGSSNPGQITLSTLAGLVGSTSSVFTTLTYNWPVRFDVDTMAYGRLVSGIWEVKKTSWTSII